MADGLRLPLDFSSVPRVPLVVLDDAPPAPETKATLDEIRALYAMDRPPAVFRYLARDPGSFRATGERRARPSPTGSSTG